MDPKSSPLAMLAKTCSQIGADPGTTGSGRKKAGGSPDHLSRNNTPVNASDKNKAESPKNSNDISRSRSSSTEIRVTDAVIVSKNHRKSPVKSDKTPTPTLRSGLEIMGGGAAHPTLRAVPPYSSSSSSLSNNPFLASFAPPSSDAGVCRDPLCRDPLCPTALRNQQQQLLNPYTSLLASPHYREAMLAYQRMAMAMASAPPGSAGGALPYVCNWVAGTTFLSQFYFERRFLAVTPSSLVDFQ